MDPKKEAHQIDPAQVKQANAPIPLAERQPYGAPGQQKPSDAQVIRDWASL